MDWTLHTDCSVSELLERFDQTARLNQLMWRPLCLAALNTPPERASAQVFLAVLRDSLGAKRAASDMLLPRRDLSALFPAAAASWIGQRGGTVHTGAKVNALTRCASGPPWQLDAAGSALGGNWSSRFDAVVVATPPAAAAALLHDLPCFDVSARLAQFTYEPITTAYLQYPAGTRLDLPFYALVEDPQRGHWGQFVFDRGQLDAGHAGMLSVVISVSGSAGALDQGDLAAALAAQLALAFGRPALASPEWTRVINDKRATFACSPALERPANATGLAGLVLAGDYTASDYPATIESAMRSGTLAARALLAPQPQP
jgi:squalene-associated FAD-dependent desaturase